MQEINGFEVVMQIRKSKKIAATPILLLSAAEPEIEGKKAYRWRQRVSFQTIDNHRSGKSN